MRYDLILSSSELFQHQIQHKNKIKTTPQNCRKFLPPTGGEIRPWFRKNSKLFLQITMGEMKKAPQAKIFVTGTIFTTKIAQKCKKIANRMFPMGGGDFSADQKKSTFYAKFSPAARFQIVFFQNFLLRRALTSFFTIFFDSKSILRSLSKIYKFFSVSLWCVTI